jgi:hypothetical protein
MFSFKLLRMLKLIMRCICLSHCLVENWLGWHVIEICKRERYKNFPLFFGKRNTVGFRYFRVISKMIIQCPLKWSGIFMNTAFSLSTCQCVWKGHVFLCLTKHHAVHKYGRQKAWMCKPNINTRSRWVVSSMDQLLYLWYPLTAICVCPRASYGTQKRKTFPCWESKPDDLVIQLMAEWLYWAVLVPFQWMHLKGGATLIHYLDLCSSQAAPKRAWNLAHCRLSYGHHW